MKVPTLPRFSQSLGLACIFACACAGGSAWAAGKPHEHGALKLDVAVDGHKLIINMEAPLDNLLGFEHAPRTETQGKAAAELLARLRSPAQAAALFVTDAAAQCRILKAEVQAPVLEVGAQAGKDEHADLDASYEFSCAQPAELRSLNVTLFDAYPRLQRVDVQVAGAKGQSKATLRRPVGKIPLTR